MKILLILFAGLLLNACGNDSQPAQDLSGEATFKVLSSSVATDLYVTGSTATFVDLETRKNITVQLAILDPVGVAPAANLLLFAGGDGIVNMTVTGSDFSIISGNFLVRTRSFFTVNNVRVIIVNAPSDKLASGMKGGFRYTDQHRYDIDSVINYLTDTTTGLGSTLPVWLVGTSRGTESAAYLALNLNYSVDGIVLTSPITVTTGAGSSLTTLALNQVTIPTLITVHESDGCSVSPPTGGAVIRDALTSSTSVSLLSYSGGTEPDPNPCSGLTYHGYYGIESTVVTDITNFVVAN